MTNPIRTTNGNLQSVSTRKVAIETTAQWIQRHWYNVAGEWEGGLFPLTDTLVTEWKDSSGTTRSSTTTRTTGESDNDFYNRHTADASTAMVANPPVP
ncbi:MAG: hypothetical protein NTV21_14490 [Planctomycetota bacterium]|nr:hypothetical protein [Planctomycetota bacterium]